MKVLFVVTHLLGTGHLARALTLGRSFAAVGHSVTIASGGMPAPQFDCRGLRLEQLPPLRSDGTDFARLLDLRGEEAIGAYLQSRKDQLSAIVANLAPDIVLTELFPFGRRALSDEFLRVISAAEALPRRPIILASIRDILNPPSKPDRAARTDALVRAHYDAVLVHSDPAVMRLETSWPVSDELRPWLRYTGFVAPPPPAPHTDHEGEGEILVSVGGGPVGQRVFDCALAAARLDRGRKWRLLSGGPCPAEPLPENVIVEAPRSDFRSMLLMAAGSVSLCGYNTALDVMQTGVPAVLIPFDDGGEVEQGLRARALARRPGFRVINTADLTADSMLGALTEAQADPRPCTAEIRFNGAARSVEIAVALAEARR